VVTGANRGIGFQVAKLLGKEQWKVVIACRDKRKGIQAAEEIKQDAGKSVEIVVVQLDLADLASVRNCVEELEKIGGKVDCLVNNAGAMLMPEITRDGFEVQYQTNYLGHFALTNWMMKRKLFAKRARIINVSSILHWFGKKLILGMCY
jgi:NAD(P)-dependent dehydrogenase (short-subunit alcohol dehydrogenase family)